MVKFLNNSIEDINDIISLTSEKQGIPEVIVEKDLWVSFILDFLFMKSKYKNLFQFKGGTSLSKGFQLINRFSEDIDIVLNEKTIDVSLNELHNVSKSKRNIKIKEINGKALNFYKEKLIPEMKNYFKETINKDLEIKLDKNQLSIHVKYPNSYDDSYIKNEVKIEIGPISAWSPNEKLSLGSYIFNSYPTLFDIGEYDVLVTAPERTFAEKVLILHKEAHRKENFPMRYSRHYYDVYKMYKYYFKENININKELLEDVRLFHEIFYYRRWANFKEASPGSFKLVPSSAYLEHLNKDYEQMKQMIYGDDKLISFDIILKTIEKIERKLNS